MKFDLPLNDSYKSQTFKRPKFTSNGGNNDGRCNAVDVSNKCGDGCGNGKGGDGSGDGRGNGRGGDGSDNGNVGDGSCNNGDCSEDGGWVVLVVLWYSIFYF